MFDYTLSHWSTFFVATVLLILSPGPNMAFILAQTARNGQRSGFAAMFGIWSGAFLHVLLAAVGLSAILVTSATAFTFVKWIGALYLFWLGIQAIRSDDASYSSETDLKQSSSMQILQLFLHGSLIIVVAVFIEPPLVILGANLTRYLSQNTQVAAWTDRGLGALLVGTGVRLAMSERA